MKQTAFLYLFMNTFSLILNIIFLNYDYKKIFANNFIWTIIKNSFYNFTLFFLVLITIDQIIYDVSKVIFYLALFNITLYIFYLSQKNIKV